MVNLKISSEVLKIDVSLNVEFEVNPLSSEIIELVKSADNHAEMVLTAADAAIAINRERVAGDADAMRNMDSLLSFIDNDESGVLHQIGLRVCNASGLGSFLSDALLAEKAIDGDKEIPDVTLEQLHEDASLVAAAG